MPAGGERGEIDSVDYEVSILYEGAGGFSTHSVLYNVNFRLGIDSLYHPGRNQRLVFSNSVHVGADLTIDIRKRESIWIGQTKPAHTDTCKRVSMQSAHTPAACHRHKRASELLLLWFRNKP